MKRNLIFLLLFSPLISVSQITISSNKVIDSAHVNYISLCNNILDINMSITSQRIIFYKTEGSQRFILYQTSNKDTISVLSECIEMLFSTKPVYDTNQAIIDDCRPGMRITYYSGTDMYQKYYLHYYEALFPFAYAELYHIFLSTVTTHRKK